MDIDYTEKRKHKRVYFKPTQEPSGIFILEMNPPLTVTGTILNLSIGGIHLALNEQQNLKQGDLLFLKILQGEEKKICEGSIALEIRWIFNHPDFNRTYLGCQFLELPDPCKKNISKLIATALESGQATS